MAAATPSFGNITLISQQPSASRKFLQQKGHNPLKAQMTVSSY